MDYPVAAVKMTTEAAEPERIESTIYDSSCWQNLLFGSFNEIKLWYSANLRVWSYCEGSNISLDYLLYLERKEIVSLTLVFLTIKY